jgi:hypothetical protein
MLNRYDAPDPIRSIHLEVDALAARLAGFAGHSAGEPE